MLKRFMGGGGGGAKSPSSSRLDRTSSITSDVTMTTGSPKPTRTKGTPPSEGAIAKATTRLRAPTLPANPNPKTVEVRMGAGEQAGSISDSIDMFLTTWNMCGASIPEPSELDSWLPISGYDLYVVVVQDCKNVKTLQKNICEYLGGDDVMHTFKYKELGTGSLSLLLFARQSFVKAGVLSPTRLNDCVKCEVKSKGLISSSSTGRGGILMQILFHNTILAFLAIRLDDTITEGALDRRVGDLEQIFRLSGIVPKEDKTDLGIPVMENVQHIFLLGDFGTRTSKHVPEALFQGARPNMWSANAWDKLRRLDEDEFETLAERVKQIAQFDELQAHYPPTSRRMVKDNTNSNNNKKKPSSPRATGAASTTAPTTTPPPTLREPSPSVCEAFEGDFDIADLYDAKLYKKEGLPSFQDRILFRTLREYTALLTEGDTGSAEMMRSSSHVPVFACFRINGVDPSLLLRWQVITGNMPVTTASRTDEKMVGGVVENLLSELDADRAARLEQEEALKLLMASMKKCNRCKLPLSIEGGDVDMGDEHGAFHRKCFACYECGKDLLGEKLMNVDNRWLCLESYDLLYRPPCPICHKATDTAVVMGRKKTRIHPHCLACVVCNKNLFDFTKKTVLPMNDLDSQAYCMADYDNARRNFCVACRRPFSDELYRAEPPHDAFHAECFSCAECGRDFHDDPVRIAIRTYQAFCAETHLAKKRPKSVRPAKRDSHLPPPPPPDDDEFDMPPPPPMMLDEALPPPPAPPTTMMTRKSVVPAEFSASLLHGLMSAPSPPPPPGDDEDHLPPPDDEEDETNLPPPPPYNDNDLEEDDDD